MRASETRILFALSALAALCAVLFLVAHGSGTETVKAAVPARLDNIPGAPLASPSPTVCPLSYSVSQATGAVLDPGTTLVSGTRCDDCSHTITLPFPVTLYDRTFTSIDLSSNGLAAFGGSDQSFFNYCPPDTDVDYAIFPLWNDWTTDNTNAACSAYPGGNCGIYTSLVGAAPNRIFNIEWRAISFDHPIPVNFELRFFEGQARFELVYGSLDLAPGHADTATVATQRDTGSAVDVFQCPDLPGALAPSSKLTFTLENPCAVASPTASPTRTFTPTSTATPSATSTPSGAGVTVRGHVLLPGRPAPPNPRWVTTISMTLRLQTGGPVYGYSAATDDSGYFTVTTSLPAGDYLWRAKDPQTLANSGSATLVLPVTSVEMGTLREGDANNDNCVTVVDFNVVRGSYGKGAGDPGYDARADFNRDSIVNVSDYNLLRTGYGLCGVPAIPPGTR